MSEPRPLVIVQIDRSRCQGTGYCEHVAPTVFRLDAGGHATLLGPVISHEARERTREPEDLCPARAIQVRPTP